MSSLFHQIAVLVTALAGLTCSIPVHAQEEPRVERFPALAAAESWNAEGGNGVALYSWPGFLGMQLDLKADAVTRLVLKNPVPLPEWATNVTFTLGSEGGRQMGFLLRVLLRDAQGVKYAYKVSSPSINGRENYIFAEHGGTWASMRLTLPGLSWPRAGVNRDANITVLSKPEGKKADTAHPKGLQIVGLEFSTVRPGIGKIYVGKFTASRVTPLTSQLYYAIDDNEGFGEIDGNPSLSLGRFGIRYGEEYRLAWTVRDRYDGQPFLSGEKSFHCDREDPAYAVNLAQRIEFPIAEQGAYWIKVRRYWNNKKAETPERIDEFDLRLDVLKGKPAVARTPLKGAIPSLAVRIAPDRASTIFRDQDKKTLAIQFTCPSAPAGYTYRVQATTPASGDVVKTAEGSLAESQSVAIPLDSLQPGAYLFRAELLRDGKLVDMGEQLVGIVSKSAEPKTEPDPKADWRKLTQGQSLAYVGMSKGPLNKSAERVQKVQQLLDEGCQLSKFTEYETKWSLLEPLPGVYDWSEIDKVVSYAGSKGMTVLLWPSFIGAEPDWIPPFFQKQKNGSITGTRPYLFQGGRINYWHSPELKQKILDLVSAMVVRYRGNPAVHGYYLLVEHGGDNAWAGFFPGYEEETLKDYRLDCRKKFVKLDALNARWGTRLANWNEISVPPADASERQRLDWYAFRDGRMCNFFVEAVKKVRSLDPYKLMMIYTGAISSDSLLELSKLGCMIADGGAAVPEAGGATTMGYVAQGVGRRTEEISVGSWSAAFPTQLDATLFNLTLGGGTNANCKMFFFPGKPFAELRKPPYSLDRFEKFLPIWSELAKTQTMPRDSYMLRDDNSGMLSAGSTGFHSDLYSDMSCFDAHLLCPAVPMRIAKTGKILFLPTRVESFEKSLVDEMAGYVRNGGTLVFSVNAGQRSPDLPGEPWVLLKRFGIAPPVEELPGFQNALLAPGIASGEAGPIKLRGPWRTEQAGGEVLATYENSAFPAITRHAFGKGFVDVVWASEIIPSTENGGYPFFRDLARQAGVRTYCDATVPTLWTNLLKNPENGSYYGTVYHAKWNAKRDALTGNTLWKLPPGDYEVTELIGGVSLGRKSAADLEKTGLPVTLEPRAVAVYRFEKR